MKMVKKITPLKNIYKKTILLLGALLGFSTAIVAQYGAPMAQYKITGTVKSKDCNVPIPKIKVSLYNNTYQPNYDPYTDSLGRFELYYADDYYIDKVKLIIEAEDEDGEANCGDFLTYEKVILIQQSNKGKKYNYSNDNESDEIIIEMEYKGKSPCKTELTEDTVPLQKPPIQKLCVLSDSNMVKPTGTDTSLYWENGNNDSLNGDGRSEPPDIQNPDMLVVYPNPSKGQYSIKLSLENADIVSMAIYDSNSKLIISESWGRCEGTLQKQFSLEGKAPGTYFLIINAGNDQFTRKLVKQ
jgi:putative lipoprotein (rSAM/lipoprotein system)